jgi:hypothetical protein
MKVVHTQGSCTDAAESLHSRLPHLLLNHQAPKPIEQAVTACCCSQQMVQAHPAVNLINGKCVSKWCRHTLLLACPSPAALLLPLRPPGGTQRHPCWDGTAGRPTSSPARDTYRWQQQQQDALVPTIRCRLPGIPVTCSTTALTQC